MFVCVLIKYRSETFVKSCECYLEITKHIHIMNKNNKGMHVQCACLIVSNASKSLASWTDPSLSVRAYGIVTSLIAFHTHTVGVGRRLKVGGGGGGGWGEVLIFAPYTHKFWDTKFNVRLYFICHKLI